MLTAFARTRGPVCICDPNNTYAADFDGIDDYAYRSAGSLKGANRLMLSMWINIQAPYWPNTALRWFWGQSILNNNQEDFIRILYQPSSTTNLIEFEFRHSGTTNSIRQQWPLHTAANSPITGSTGSTNYWTSANTNITTNANGYVHLMFVYEPGGGIGGSVTNSNVDCYWNGQLLTGTLNYKSGTIVNNGITTNVQGLSINPFNFSTANCTDMYMDQFLQFIAGSEQFMAINLGLSGLSDQDYATLLYNCGCPKAIPIDARYQAWQFEGTWDWDANPPYPLTWTPANGATFTTNHA